MTAIAEVTRQHDRPRRAYRAGVRAQRLPTRPGAAVVAVTEADLEALPPAARRYLRFTGVLDRPRDWSFQAHLTGRFRRRPDQRWLACDTWQYDSGLEVARLFHMRLQLGPLRMSGWDTYRHGRGRMRGTVLGVVPVVDGHGPEFDVSELVTYLNDAVLLAPSLLLGLRTTWSGAGPDAFDVSLADAGHRVTARVTVDDRGAVLDFSTDDRYADLPGGPVRARWTTPVPGWITVDGRPRPTSASAVWHLPSGPLKYGEFDLGGAEIRYNLAPG